MLQEQAWLQAVHSVNSGSEEISSNCSLWTFCARLNFELQFFPSLDKPRLLYASSSLFCPPPPPTLEELPMQIKMVRALDLQCLPVALYREGTRMPTGTGERASLQHLQDYCWHLLPMGRGRQRHADSRLLSLVRDPYCKLTKKGTSGCFKQKLSKQCVHNKVQQSPRVLPEA